PPRMLGRVIPIAVLPLVRWARGHGWPGWAATLLSLVAACAMLLVFVVGLSLAAVKLVDMLPQSAGVAAELRADLKGFLTSNGIASDPADTTVDQIVPAKLTALLSD